MTALSTAAPILIVTDVAAAVGDYSRWFGFADLAYFAGNDEYVVLGLQDAQIHLMQGRDSNPNHRHGMHVADAFVWVRDLDAGVASASAAGLTARRGPEHYDSSPVATTEVVFEDSDGNWICFATRD